MANRFKPYLPLIAIGALALALLVGAAAILILNIQPQMTTSPSKTTTSTILLYEGELANGKFGFGTAPNNLTSPGPTLRFSTSDTINITVVNVGKLPHAFAITSTPSAGGLVLFNGVIGSASDPLNPGQSGSCICRAYDGAFDYWYISPFSGDVSAGMYGAVIVSSVTGPAFP